ncbi:MAG TPA: FtsX-like permease family protein [Steroidobacteraceae bacterium]|nr:FtsX-like permease family protein [Steroidobacteraceae bacterium]
MANAFSQIGAVTAMNVRNIPERWASSLVAVVGIGGVTLVLIAVLSIAAGFKQALELSGSPDVAIILRSGSTNEMSSGFGLNQVTLIAEAPGIRKDDKSRPLYSAELYVLTEGKLKNKEADANSANLPFRGVSPSAPLLRKSFRIEEGRMMREGTNEIMVGDGVASNYEDIAVGRKVRWGNADWEIVGRFSDDGGIAESEAWADARLVQQVWNRGTSFQSVRVRLTDESDATLKKLKDNLTKNPQLQVAVTREPQFYAEQQEMMSTLITGAGIFFAILMGLAAIFAAVNTMLNAVASRVREIATLRAMGFGAAPVVFSVIIEALLLGAAGGLLGGLLALVLLNGMQSSTMNFQTFSQITYAFTVTPGLMIVGIIYGLLLTFVASILPGIRAARMPITSGLREL